MHLVKIGNQIFNMDKIFATKYNEKGRGEGPLLTLKSENGDPNTAEIVEGDLAVLFWKYICVQVETEITEESSPKETPKFLSEIG